MIVTRTPMRISFVGGGTDMPSFYMHHDGAVISMTIDKYVYIVLNPRFDGQFRISYSKTEICEKVEDIQHDIAREILKMFGLKGMEVVSVSDIPGEGSGLGSSSAFTVGLLNAVNALTGHKINAGVLAETAFMVESQLCGHPVGKQDHYAAACGGCNHYIFRGKSVKVEGFGFLDEELAMLHSNLMLFWTGVTRKADDILVNQSNALKEKKAFEHGLLMTEVVDALSKEFNAGDFDKLGRSVAVDWKLKKTFSNLISADWIDAMIDVALKAGATGAKICGAGGGGFLLVVADPKFHKDIKLSMTAKQIPFKVETRGSAVVLSEGL